MRSILIITVFLIISCNEVTVEEIDQNNTTFKNSQPDIDQNKCNSVCIYNSKTYLLLNLDNPIEIINQNIPCSNIIVHTNNGSVKKSNNDRCYYILKPSNSGKLTLSVYKKIKTDSLLITKKEFRVKPLFKATAHIAVWGYKGDISKEHLINLREIKAPVINHDIDIRNEVVSFTFLAFRGKDLLFFQDYTTGKFNDDIKSKFNQLKRCDRIMFTNIVTKSIYNHQETINSIEYYIK